MKQITSVFQRILDSIQDRDRDRVWRVLWNNVGRPLKMPEICQLSGVADRPARILIGRFRGLGLPICASSLGYWLSLDDQEIEATERRFRKRADECNAIADGLAAARETVNRIKRQEPGDPAAAALDLFRSSL